MRLARRRFLQPGAAAATIPAVSAGWAADAIGASPPVGQAEHCLLIWLGGGPAQIDTFDPKRKTKDGKKDPGCYYESIDTAIPGVKVCEHLARTAPLMDRCVPVRTVHHDVIDEHAAAAYRMHTGRPTSGTIVYPALGSLIIAVKEALSELMPGYVLIGNPSPAREPGFLGAKYGYLYLTETASGPKGLVRPERISAAREERRVELLRRLRDSYVAEHADRMIENYVEATELGFRLAGPEFMSVFNLDEEPDDLRNAYGDEFGQRCLLSRRLVERGARFVEISFNLNFKNGTGWDTHNEGQLGQHFLIQSLDQAFSTLLTDLEEKKLLDKTVIVIAGEFGRPAHFDAGGGRGHHGKCFSVLLAGGGLRTGQAIGTTDDLAMEVVDRPVGVPDLFATILAAMGIDPALELYAGSRPVPITDRGVPIAELFG
jgi:hypothetical protein